MPIPKDNNRPIRQIEEALLGLVRLVKALSFYPPGHSFLQNAVGEAHKGFEALLGSGEPLELTVRMGELRLADTPLGTDHPVLKKLALHLFSRRIRTLTLLPGLRSRDLLALASCLCGDPSRLQRQGGIAAVLQKEKVATVQVSEADISHLLHHSQEAEQEDLPEDVGEEAQTAKEGPPPGETIDPAELLYRLQNEKSDYRFRQTLRALLAFIRRNLKEKYRYQILDAVDALVILSTAVKMHSSRQEEILAALEELGTEDVLHYFVLFLGTPALEDDLRRRLVHLLFFYRDVAARPLMEYLAGETDPRVRRTILETLTSLESTAQPVLIDYLEDERWYVVRNAVAILGEMRLPETVSLLRKMTRHPDIRVRRESLRSLTRIGGDEALGLLIETARGGDPDLKMQSLLSLGALRDPGAAPALMEIAELPDRWMKQVEIRKGAIKALGEIGAPEALPLLLDIVKKRPLWQRRRADEIRAAAVTALGEMASDEAAAALERATDDPSAAVARAAVQALKNLRKDGHGSGIR